MKQLCAMRNATTKPTSQTNSCGCDNPAGGSHRAAKARPAGRTAKYISGWRRPSRVRRLSDTNPMKASQKASMNRAMAKARLTHWAGIFRIWL